MGSNASSMRSNGDYTRFQSRIQALYLERQGANIHYTIQHGQEPVYAHRWVMEPYLQYEHISSENNGIIEIDLSESEISVASFEEFLKFIHLKPRNLTVNNIDDVMFMARRWQLTDGFTECKQFLKKSIGTSTCLAYKLAFKYDANDLKALFEEEICVNPTGAFRSDDFQALPHELVAKIIENDSLACKEIRVFDACIAWARSKCRQMQFDPSNVENVRNALDGLLYRIRFTSMSNEEAAHCINAHRQLFNETELTEILCMIGRIKSFKPKQFNWTPRYVHLSRKKELVCSRLPQSDDGNSKYAVQQVEVTRFTCNRRIELHGIELELHSGVERSIGIQIIERNQQGLIHQRYDPLQPCDLLSVQFAIGRSPPYDKARGRAMHSTACIPLNPCIILRPTYTYDIRIDFQNQRYVSGLERRCGKRKVRVDHDLVFQFEDTGVVSALQFRRFKNRHRFAKILHNPTFWIWMAVITVAICIIAVLYELPAARQILSIIVFLYIFALICTCCC